MSLDLEKNWDELDMSELVKVSVEEALGHDNSQNVGHTENHCDQQIKEYYLKLANKDKEALEKQQEMLKRFLSDERF